MSGRDDRDQTAWGDFACQDKVFAPGGGARLPPVSFVWDKAPPQAWHKALVSTT
jgi:hypothetical protein